MPAIDLTRYIVAATGTWTDPSKDENLFDFTLADTRSPERLMLRWAGDFVALTGPLRVRVTVQSENITLPLAFVGNLVPDAAATVRSTPANAESAPRATISATTALYESALARVGKRALTLQAGTIYEYTLEIAAGQAWPFSLSEQLDVLKLRNAYTRYDHLGNNLGYRVIIEPVFGHGKLVPVQTPSDIPCDFAVGNHPDAARFFPVACEPCNGSVVGLPPGASTLVTPPAEGGCVRTRFFNGMFITREDLETEQRYMRVKSRLHNRASGAGVVWGFGVGKSGSAVCVLPGYGVDCCGNDLTITSTYKVDIAALLADPASAAVVRTRGPHNLSLLLEYVECPSDARPVHGDPCAPEASRCEMSRIRESVRLRLVPPCTHDLETGPLQGFLDDARSLRQKFPIGQNATGAVVDRAPFQVRVTLNDDAANAVLVRPGNGSTTLQFNQTGAIKSIAFEPVMDSMWTFVQGSLSGETPSAAGAAATADGRANVTPPDPIDLALTDLAASRNLRVTVSQVTSGQVVFRLQSWKAQTVFAGQADAVPGGDLTFTMALTRSRITNNTLEMQMTVAPVALAESPCAGEPCGSAGDPGGASDCADAFRNRADYFLKRSASVLPWMHTDPVHPNAAGDPKALVMAALGGWLSELLVREQGSAANQQKVSTVRREIVQAVYRAAWLFLFGVSQEADQSVVGESLRKLLERLCDGLLWTGPRCCCDPHGVVIGCAVVEGGTIQRIDPFGGRRYVIHYPLLAHWGAQFGIAPPDITVMRFFSRICCLAGLAAPTADSPNIPAAVTQIGSGYLAVGDPADLAEKLKGKNIVAKRSVSTAEIIGTALTMAGRKPATGDSSAGQALTALVLANIVPDQTVMLLVPE